MVRMRSKSVVQRIASEVPSHSQGEIKLESESADAKNIHNPTIPRGHVEPTAFTGRQRALSLSMEVKVDILPETQILFPFTEAEKERLVLNFLDTLNYNSVLDSDHIDSVNELYDDQILAFKADCDLNIVYFRDLIDESAAVVHNLSQLAVQYDKVTKDTLDFATQSTALLQKQEELDLRAQQVDRVLQMFEPLERISKTLVSSGSNIIRTGRLTTILDQLQTCLDFLGAHDNYKDTEFYTIRYRQCMTRGLTLVRSFLIDYLKTKQTTLTQELQEKDMALLKLDILMYSGFTLGLDKQDETTKFPVLVGAIVDKCTTHSEYRGLVTDVMQQYFRVRLQLIQHYVQQHGGPASDLATVAYCQKYITLFKKLLEKEYVLFLKFFPVASFAVLQQAFVYDELYQFFKQALEPLYDEVRNRVLREVSITELCHLTNLLTSYFDYDDDILVGTGTLNDVKIEYGELFEPMLNDSQARLIFRIQNYIDNRLLKYKPTPEDLQLGNRKKESRKNSAVSEFQDNLFPDLYVPVGIALTILSNIYELVNSMVFDDIAHHIIHSCIYMLKNGAVKLAVAHLGPVEARLFYVKNLVMLKNQLNNFDIQFVRTETSVDFTSGIQELIQILRNGQLYVQFNERGGLLELVKKSAPKVINDMIDAKHEIELELSNSVNEFVTECTNTICAPILSDSGASLKEKAVQVNDSVLMKMPQMHAQIRLFIAEDEIVRYLVDMLAQLVSSTYETYYKTLEHKLAKKEISPEDMDNVMEPETFYNFVSETVASFQQDDVSADRPDFDLDLEGFDGEEPHSNGQTYTDGEPNANDDKELILDGVDPTSIPAEDLVTAEATNGEELKPTAHSEPVAESTPAVSPLGTETPLGS